MKFWDIFESVARSVLQGENSPVNEMERILEATRSGDRIAFYPCNRYSRKVLNLFKKEYPSLFSWVTSVFDKSNNLNFMKGIPIFNLNRLPEIEIDKLIVTSSRFPIDIKVDLDTLGFPNNKVFLTSLFWMELSSQDPDDIIEKIKEIVEVLADERSKMSYMLIWLSILLLDKNILSVFPHPADLEYSPDGKLNYAGMELSHIECKDCQYGLLLELYKMENVFPEVGDIVLDIGAYRGDTVAFFQKYVGESGTIYAFEPDDINYNYLVKNIEKNGMRNVIPVKKALFNGKTKCNLIATSKGSSFLYVLKDEVDTDQITETDAITLDNFATSEKIPRVDFIKSDIEGCEMEMLEGAENTIEKYRPKLAIAIYHSISDLVNIPLYVNKVNPNYEIYIRHNTTVSPWEIILYAR